MKSTEAMQAPAAGTRNEGQLIVGRYRLVIFHRGDDRSEVWRALDQTKRELVTLEFLKDREVASREFFLADARRMQAREHPTVMKVAEIRDEKDETFIVFEHLTHIQVPPEALKRAAEMANPGSTAPLAPVAPLPAFEPRADAPAAQSPAQTPAAPAVAAAPAVVATPQATESSGAVSVEPTERGLTLLLHAIRIREFALIDAVLLKEAAIELAQEVREQIEDLHLEEALAAARALGEQVVAELRALLARATPEGEAAVDRADSWLRSLLAGVFGGLRELAKVRPRVPAPHVSMPQLRVPRPNITRTQRVRPPKAERVRQPAAPRAPQAPRTLRLPTLRVRWGRVLFRGVTVGAIVGTLLALPPDVLANLGTNAVNIGNEVRTTITERAAALLTPTTPGLQRASFELPPLSSYGAAFYAQAPYPVAHPNGDVEWVVALRNTGSVGWYRGIDGAQASLVLADGTNAAVQSTAYVGPGQVGWFVVHFRAPAEPGNSQVYFFPRIDGRGALPDLGIYARVTVTPSP